MNTGSAQAVTVTVIDVNDSAPSLISSSVVSVLENETAVLVLAASDADTTGEAIDFALAGTDSALFQLAGGTLSFQAPPDFEAPICGGDNQCQIELTPTDGVNTGSIQTVTVTVLDVNDNAPSMTSANAVFVLENETAVLTLAASDVDTTGEGIQFILGGADAAQFQIEGDALSFQSAADFETPICGGDHQCQIELTPSDGVNTGSAQAVTVTITDVNDSAPVMTSASAISVLENELTVLTLAASDADTTGEAIDFALAGTDSALFQLAGSELSFQSAPDFEAPVCSGGNQCEIEITPSDGTNTGAAQALTVTVVDVENSIVVSDRRVDEGDSGSSLAALTVTLTTPALVDVDYTIRDGSATLADGDYTANPISGTLSFSGGVDSAEILFDVNGDMVIEGDETVIVQLSNPVNAEFFAGDSATLTIVNDDNELLNDTGVQFGGVYDVGRNDDCSGTEIGQQDCSHGRDAEAAAGTLAKVGAGVAGFDYTKLGADGAPLAIQNVAWNENGNEADGSRWSCVRDNHTGLTWEVKVADTNSIHYLFNLYRWGGLSAVGRNNFGREGSYFDDWNTLVEGTNSEVLCGFDDWRVATLHGLQSLLHLGASPTIDTNYFPNIIDGAFYWSASPALFTESAAWSVVFRNGEDSTAVRSVNFPAILVRGRRAVREFIPTVTLNDTGIQFGGVYEVGRNDDCSGTEIGQQDCSHGRDAEATAGTLIKVGAGAAGFDYTKLGADGEPLAIQDVAWNENGSEAAGSRWSCVRDNHTKLVWEVKVADVNSIHYFFNLYAWGGLTAVGRNHTEREDNYFDDWNVLVEGSNDEVLCGLSNWGGPTLVELQSLMHLGRSFPAIDTDYFPNIATGAFYWSASPVATSGDNSAWSTAVINGEDHIANRRSTLPMLLVSQDR